MMLPIVTVTADCKITITGDSGNEYIGSESIFIDYRNVPSLIEVLTHAHKWAQAAECQVPRAIGVSEPTEGEP